nr:HMG-Y-related protein A-like [Ipomoea batatas]
MGFCFVGFQMILEALHVLKQKERVNKFGISKYIESKYGGMSDAHSKLLTFHLERIMKQSGDLIFLKNNYIKPGPDTPPKRGCGRRPKPKAPVAPGTIFAPPRPRGRPRKDPNAHPLPKRPRRRLPLRPRPTKEGSPSNPDYDSDYAEFLAEFLADDSLGDTPPASPATPDTTFPTTETDHLSPPSQTPSMVSADSHAVST